VSLQWQKRCKRADTDVADRRQWWTVCKNYYIEESNIRYGRKRDEKDPSASYPIVYRVMIKSVKRDDEYGKRIERFDILAAHKTKRAAVQALEYYIEHRKLPPKQTKAKRHQKTKRRQKAKRKAKATA
jgi:hypothetical protein